MPKGLLFWILMLLWFFFGASQHDWSGSGPNAGWRGFGSNLLLLVLFFLLGWQVFGFVIQ